jgi:ribosomal protein S18 acetylase RimI-like enzyme
MNIRQARPEESEEISRELWLPLAREMEDVSDYNRLREDFDIKEVVDHKREKITEEEGFFFVAEEGDQLIGFVTGEVKESVPVFSRGEKLKINELFVKERFRRNGVASMMLGKLERKARKRGCSTVELDVNKENRSAQELYRSKGFDTERKRMVKEI